MKTLISILLVTCLFGSLHAQTVIQTPDGKTVTLPAGADAAAAQAAMLKAQAARGAPGAKPGVKPGEKPGEKGKAEESKQDKKGEDGKSEKDSPLENVKRTAEPPDKPDPEEFKVKPDDDGLLYFQFRNQPWPAVLRWYAVVCRLSFDWQELPGDYINLATQRPHSLQETGDMINRALLMRGFTMLQDDESLTVAKVEGLNPALVPRVRPADLSSLPPHKYVRTSFTLSWLLAEEVHEEFNSMISKNGKLVSTLR